MYCVSTDLQMCYAMLSGAVSTPKGWKFQLTKNFPHSVVFFTHLRHPRLDQITFCMAMTEPGCETWPVACVSHCWVIE